MVQNSPNNSLLVLCNEIKHFIGCCFNNLFHIIYGCSSMDNVDFNNLPLRSIRVECRASYLSKDNTSIANDNKQHTDR